MRFIIFETQRLPWPSAFLQKQDGGLSMTIFSLEFFAGFSSECREW